METNLLCLLANRSCATHTVTQVLSELKDDLQIGKSRRHLSVVTDPHIVLIHVSAIQKHEWAVLHMNQMKTLFKVLDKVSLEPLGKEVLHFESPKDYNFFLNAKNTHIRRLKP